MPRSLRARLVLLMLLSTLSGVAVHAGLTQWPLPQVFGWTRTAMRLAWTAPAPGSAWAIGLTAAIVLPFCAWAAHAVLAPLSRLLRALEGGVLSYRDGDFSLSLAPGGHGELGELVRLHNELGQALREQRQHLVQRELLLDTVVQNTPVALVLTDAGGRVAYANIAARQLLGEGRSLQGLALAEVLASAPQALRDALAGGEDTLFSVDLDGSDETFHVSQRGFRSQNNSWVARSDRNTPELAFEALPLSSSRLPENRRPKISPKSFCNSYSMTIQSLHVCLPKSATRAEV